MNYGGYIKKVKTNGTLMYLTIVLVLVFLIIAWKENWFAIRDGDDINGVWNAKNEAVRLHQMLSSWDLGTVIKKNAFDLILSYDDSQLREVVNVYARKYRGEKYATLRESVQAEWTVTYNIIILQQEVLKRLTEIGA